MNILPKPEYPFPDLMNPCSEAINAETSRWLTENYGFLSSEMVRRYVAADFGRITARCLPHVEPYERLLPCARFMLWATVLDDYCEYYTVLQLADLRQRILDIFNGGDTTPDEHFLIREAAVIRKELEACMPFIWMRRFTRSLYTYLASMESEVPYKDPSHFPTLQTFLPLRETTIGVQPFLDFIEMQTDQILPDEVYAHPYMRQLYSLTARMFAFCNDFYSVEKDLGREPLNLVFVLQHEKNISLEEANQQALCLHNEDLRELIYLQDKVPDFGPYTSTVHRFAFYLGVMLQGHAQWYIKDTWRYKPGGHPESNTFRNISTK